MRLLGEDDHIHQLDRCLSDDSMPLDLRVGGALILLFGLLASRVMQLFKNDVIDDGEVIYLDIDSHRLMLPPRLARLVRQLRDRNAQRWTLARLGTPAPWLFPWAEPCPPRCGRPLRRPAPALRHQRLRRPKHRTSRPRR